MQHAHSDLLLYEDIDRDVERIYRAFLDTTLMEFAQSPNDYWGKVVRFRRDHLNSLDMSRTMDVRANRPMDFENEVKKWKEGADISAFLYWFDVRAAYWSKGGDSALLNSLVPSDQLAWLYQEAVALELRIVRAKQEAQRQEGAESEESSWALASRNERIASKIAATAKKYSTPPPPVPMAFPDQPL